MDLILVINTDDDKTLHRCLQLAEDNASLDLYTPIPRENSGQHRHTNFMINKADENGYDYLLRLDDDVKFLTKGWLKRLVDIAEDLGPDFIISPLVRGLSNPPPQTETLEVKGHKVRFLEAAIGGICRLHRVDTLVDPECPYVADVRGPMGFGDATGIGLWCKQAVENKGMKRWMVYTEKVRVQHRLTTKKQREEDQGYHIYQRVFQCIPFIPAWRQDA